MKAIHNNKLSSICINVIVSSHTKIQIWKQFTTAKPKVIAFRLLWVLTQKYKFESNSQPYGTSLVISTIVSSHTKIQIWKQFTTTYVLFDLGLVLWVLTQKYKFESNSQRGNMSSFWINDCEFSHKNTNLKAIHNGLRLATSSMSIVSSHTKIQIWKQFTTFTVLRD